MSQSIKSRFQRIFLHSILISFFVALGTIYFAPMYAQAIVHPFLIVNPSDYVTLQGNASTQPWANMKTRAKNTINDPTIIYDTSLTAPAKSDRMTQIVTAGALAYILETNPTTKATYKDKLVSTLYYWNDLSGVLNYLDWDTTVRPGIAFFDSVIALDIIHDDLTSQELSDIESRLQTVADWYWSKDCSWNVDHYNCSWVHNQFATRGIWAIYKQDRPKIDQAKADYKNAVLHYLTSDGVYDESIGYAWARFGGTEDTKSYFMEVLEHTGEDTTIYSNPQIKGFFEWLYSGSLTPFKQRVTFGDAAPEFYPGTSGFDEPAAFWAHEFSNQAAQNASWLDSSPNPAGRLLNYLSLSQAMPTPVKPLSRIWPSAEASFWEDNPSSQSLMGALWNPQISEGHSHYDVNAVHLSAYGENILRNVGYPGWQNVCVNTSFDFFAYVHDYAASSNTVLIDGQNHVAKQGNGIVEGFVNQSLDYASGDSGGALPNGKDVRNLLMVHPNSQAGLGGYFILVDEVTANAGSQNVNIALHPSSANYVTTSNLQEYKWTINQYSGAGHNVDANIFLGTTPSTVAINDGALCSNTSTYAPGFVGKYLYATYPLTSTSKNIVTVIFPADSSHPKASMTRISGSNYSGAQVNIGAGTSDIILENSSGSSITYQGVSFNGIAAWYRLASGSTSYFVKKGTSFNDGQSSRTGFDSTANVSVYVKGNTGSIISPSADVTFYEATIGAVKLDGQLLTTLQSGSGFVKVHISSGTHQLDFVAANPVPTITTISPASVAVGSQNVVLTVNGTNFLPTSTIYFQGLALQTNYVSTTQLTTTLSSVPTSASYSVTVTTPSPGGGTSNSATFTVNPPDNPIPTIATISPVSVVVGSSQTTITVNGTNFMQSGSVVSFNGFQMGTTVISTTQLTAVIPAANFMTAGTYPVIVTNPAPGGGISNTVTFTVSVPNNPLPTITSITPASAAVGDPGFTLTVTGTNFISTSVVNFQGLSLTTTFVSPTQLTIPINIVPAAGTYSVTVTTPAPGGGTSSSVDFIVTAPNNPIPTISNIFPSALVIGSPQTTITVNGTNFMQSGSVVSFNGMQMGTTFVSSTQLTAIVPAINFTTTGAYPVIVNNPAPGGGVSNTATLVVNTAPNPPPTVTDMFPTSKTVGDPGFTLTVSGVNFISSSTINLQGLSLPTTYVSNTQLTTSITSQQIAVEGSYNITVVNPAPGGGTSDEMILTVNPPVATTTSIRDLSPASAPAGSPQLTLTINGANFNPESQVFFDENPKTTTYVSSTRLTAVILASDLVEPGTRSIMVTTPGQGDSNTLTFTVSSGDSGGGGSSASDLAKIVAIVIPVTMVIFGALIFIPL